MTTQKDRVAEVSTSIGTGPLVLEGPVVGYRTFATAFGAGGNTEVYYGIIQDLSGEWETGLGTYLGPSDTLRRDLVLASSNGGSPVNFPLGDKAIYVTFPADTTLTLRSRRAGDRTLTLYAAPGQGPTPILSIFGSDGNEGITVTGTSGGTLTIASPTPNVTFAETDFVAPAGRHRIMVTGGALEFQRMSVSPSTFTTVAALDPEGVAAPSQTYTLITAEKGDARYLRGPAATAGETVSGAAGKHPDAAMLVGVQGWTAAAFAGGTITINASATATTVCVYRVMAGAEALALPTLAPGQIILFRAIQDATGGRVLTPNAAMAKMSFPPALSTVPNGWTDFILHDNHLGTVVIKWAGQYVP